MSNDEELAQWPSRGNRRRLEERWLEQLERRGLATFLPEPPGVAPPQLSVAVDQFNAGAFWDCHETLEEVWLDTPYPLRFFYHSIIKGRRWVPSHRPPQPPRLAGQAIGRRPASSTLSRGVPGGGHRASARRRNPVA